jgi:hypothetical protein
LPPEEPDQKNQEFVKYVFFPPIWYP